ncbi:Protein CBG28106 [Caenorhabditis briggsae]|uniref:Protein CBG28106 n=2 Tax=Caenorhabditis briggsae TaxID=6238 RepID=B6IGU5_CAEBR|nr:Protein CBG28106 [Caenorhabditis briggsae]UMM44249.1 hypothetical protein L5515_019433 [Caenorhabditis briggsae]CAR99125.1 Protein CBG28106 [Caenorhabditis briggsae]
MANTVRISSIRTENFPRGNRPLNVGFGTNFAVVRGDNGSGKTTLIKAVAFAALDKDLPIIGLENSTVAVSFRKNGVETTFKRTTKRSISRFSINDGRVQKRTYQTRLHGFIKAEHLKFCLDYNHPKRLDMSNPSHLLKVVKECIGENENQRDLARFVSSISTGANRHYNNATRATGHAVNQMNIRYSHPTGQLVMTGPHDVQSISLSHTEKEMMNLFVRIALCEVVHNSMLMMDGYGALLDATVEPQVRRACQLKTAGGFQIILMGSRVEAPEIIAL